MLSHGRVMLVSSFDDRLMYAEYLRHHALIVDEFQDPEEAIRFLSSLPPDVVVTDAVFDVRAKNGAAFIEQLRSRLDDSASIVVVSGYVRQTDRQMARAAGADVYLTKPVLPRDVLYQVRRALAARTEGRRLRWTDAYIGAAQPGAERRNASIARPLAMASDRPRRRAGD
jgi:CheY-like chemotaxis protein